MCLSSCTTIAAAPDPTESPSAESLPSENLPVEETVPATETPDTTAPVISGVQDLTAPVGGTLSYRTGVTAVDDRDGTVPFQIDTSGVDLTTPGEYRVVYSAEDSSGNRSEVVATVVITEADPEPTPSAATQTQTSTKKTPTLAEVEALADKVLAKITNDGMTQREKARAIYDYVRTHIKYVGYSDKSSWIVGAYTGFTSARGDCFNYFACSKILLTRAGIANVDLTRVGGPTRHYWQLVNVGDGYYHFDACPHDNNYPLVSFMLTEDQVRAYTALRGKNYYVYDYANCPVPVVGLSESERNPQGTVTPEPKPEVTPEPTPEVTPEPTPEVPEEPAPEITAGLPSEHAPELPEEPIPEATLEPEPAPVPESAVQPEDQEG